MCIKFQIVHPVSQNRDVFTHFKKLYWIRYNIKIYFKSTEIKISETSVIQTMELLSNLVEIYR